MAGDLALPAAGAPPPFCNTVRALRTAYQVTWGRRFPEPAGSIICKIRESSSRFPEHQRQRPGRSRDLPEARTALGFMKDIWVFCLRSPSARPAGLTAHKWRKGARQ